MKRILFIFFSALLSITSQAQVDVDSKTLAIAGYQDTAALFISGQKVIVKIGDIADSFSLQKNGDKLSLLDANDTSKIYKKLRLEPTQLNTILAEQAGANAIDKLLDITSKMTGQKLILKGDNAPLSEDTNTLEEGAMPAPEVQDAGSNKWLIPSVIGLLALVLGFLLGKGLKTKVLPEAPTMAPSAKLPLASKDDTSSKITDAELKSLKDELNDAKEKNKLYVDKTQKLIDGDNLYYQSVFDKIILPIQKALDENNQEDLVKNLSLAMIHFSSISRIKIRKKQKYDDANIQLIIGNSSLTEDFPTIDAHTPIDKIPANLRALIQLLQENHVNGLGDTIVKGYKIKGI